MLENVKVNDTVHTYMSPDKYEVMTVVRLTPNYVCTECGNKYRIKDGQPSGTSWGMRAEPGEIAPVEEEIEVEDTEVEKDCEE